jgi:hypothetical protein
MDTTANIEVVCVGRYKVLIIQVVGVLDLLSFMEMLFCRFSFIPSMQTSKEEVLHFLSPLLRRLDNDYFTSGALWLMVVLLTPSARYKAPVIVPSSSLMPLPMRILFPESTTTASSRQTTMAVTLTRK